MQMFEQAKESKIELHVKTEYDNDGGQRQSYAMRQRLDISNEEEMKKLEVQVMVQHPFIQGFIFF